MSKWKLTQWSCLAASLVRYPPDQKAVRQELRDHLEDRFEDFIGQGLSEQDAVEHTLEAMGDPQEVAAMLAAVHRPFWGYFYQISKAVFLFLLALVISMSVRLFVNHLVAQHGDIPDEYYRLNEVISDQHSAVKTKHLHPNAAMTLDGYTFTAAEAVQWHVAYTDTDGTTQEFDQLHFQLVVNSPYPIHQTGDIGYYFWAVDSTGRIYESMFSHDDQFASAHLRGNVCITGINEQTYYMWLSDYISADVQWIELRYDRSGRDIRLRIDLKGGAAS